MIWALLFLLILIIAAVVYWLIIITEGVYLGQRIVTHLYDRVAPTYDQIKSFNNIDEYYHIAVPLTQALDNHFDGLILDIAAGTGRVTEAMTRLPNFQGQVIGVDHSTKMLRMARRKMPQAPLVQADAQLLPFASQSVQAVTSLEAMEFMPKAEQAISEMSRVLKSKGTLLITNRAGWESKLMPGKAWSAKKMTSVLTNASFEDVAIRLWESVNSFDIRAGNDKATEKIIENYLAELPFHKRLVMELTTSRYDKVWARKVQQD